MMMMKTMKMTTTKKKLTMSVSTASSSSSPLILLFLLLLLLLMVTTSMVSGISNNGRRGDKVSSNVHNDIVTGSSRSILSFDDWVEFHDKSYTSKQEYLKRLHIWHHNNENIVKVHNKAFDEGLTSYRMSIIQSPFADLTCEEFSKYYLMPKKPREHCALAAAAASASDATNTPTPTKSYDDHHQQHQQPRPQQQSYPSIDWRDHGVMTKVKDQGRCGSCWTFSTTGTLEAHTCLAHHRHDCYVWPGLSEQQLVDCSTPFENEGCNGGWPSSAFEYIKYNDGIESETSYPYHGKDQNCSAVPSLTSHQNQDAAVAAEVSEVYNITYQDEDDFQNVLATVGPVSFAFQVSPDFRFYSSGVYDSYNATTNKTMCHGDEQYLNHAVVAVGMGIVYEDDDDDDDDDDDSNKPKKEIPYYIVRNSWSSDWAMEGYFWLKRGENLCGVSDCASFPIVPVTAQHPLKSLDDHRNHRTQNDQSSNQSQPNGHEKEQNRLNQKLHLRSSS